MEDLNLAASITTRNRERSKAACAPCNPTAGHVKHNWSRARRALGGKHRPYDNVAMTWRMGGDVGNSSVLWRTAGPQLDTKLPCDMDSTPRSHLKELEARTQTRLRVPASTAAPLTAAADGQMEKQNVVYADSGILFSHEKG